MAWGDPVQLTLRISGQEYTTLGWVYDSMAALEYAYNLVAVVQLVDEGHIHSEEFKDLVAVFRRSSELGFPTLNLLLRSFIPPDAQARLEGLETGHSFTIKFGGIAKAINAIAAIFDPARRAAQQEDDRHQAEMNRLDEEDKRTEVFAKRLRLLEEIIDNPRSLFSERVEELAVEQREAIRANLYGESARIIRALGNNETEALDDTA